MRPPGLDWVFEVVGIEKITDGDTYWLRLDVGFRQHQLTEIRLYDWDTPELFRPRSDFERDRAREAKAVVERWFTLRMSDPAYVVLVETEKDPDSFGRWLGDVHCVDATNGLIVEHLSTHLRDLGLASEWPTRWRDEFDTET